MMNDLYLEGIRSDVTLAVAERIARECQFEVDDDNHSAYAAITRQYIEKSGLEFDVVTKVLSDDTDRLVSFAVRICTHPELVDDESDGDVALPLAAPIWYAILWNLVLCDNKELQTYVRKRQIPNPKRYVEVLLRLRDEIVDSI